MRYHKAVAINKVEADFIAETSVSSRNENVVICHGEQWYDVRALSERELEEFVADLLRAQLDQLRSGLLAPHYRGASIRAICDTSMTRRAQRKNNIGDYAGA